MAGTPLPGDRRRDATDCRRLYDAGSIRLFGVPCPSRAVTPSAEGGRTDRRDQRVTQPRSREAQAPPGIGAAGDGRCDSRSEPVARTQTDLRGIDVVVVEQDA